jgi:hypothetical protein
MTDRTGSRRIKQEAPLRRRASARAPARPPRRRGIGWGLLALVCAIGLGWLLLRAIPVWESAPPVATVTQVGQETTAAPPASVGGAAGLPAAPSDHPGESTEQVTARRASDEELRKQLPPNAVISE